MSFGLTYTGAIARGLAYPPTAPRESEPAPTPAADPSTVGVALDPVLPESAPDGMGLFHMSSLERIHAEAEMMARAAVRAMQSANKSRAWVQAEANFVDLRV